MRQKQGLTHLQETEIRQNGSHVVSRQLPEPWMEAYPGGSPVSHPDYPDGPPEFSEHGWPHPKLVDNKPQGKDEALVWFMDYYREHISNMGPVRRKKG